MIDAGIQGPTLLTRPFGIRSSLSCDRRIEQVLGEATFTAYTTYREAERAAREQRRGGGD